MRAEHEELESLLFDWEAGTLDELGLERIREILRNDEATRAHFVQLQMISAALKLEIDAGIGMPTEPRESIPPVPRQAGRLPSKSEGSRAFRISYWAAAAAVLLVFVLAGRLVWVEFVTGSDDGKQSADNDNAESRPEPREATSRGVALVTRLVDVVWDRDQIPLEVGDALTPGRLAIESGYAQVEFFCGATVILEGPAELDLESATLARMRHGRLRAQVPPAARGFAIEVADMKVVDLGTEFGLSVSPESADVQVFKGEVELHRPAEETRQLTAGQALIRTAEGSYNEIKITPDRFVDVAELESRAEEQQNARYQHWQKWSAEMRLDPRLIAYYAIDEGDSWQRTLKNSIEPANSEFDGAIVGAGRVSGRWASKGALEFKRPADRVRVQIPGDYRSLTFACWVKIDSLDRWYNSLFLTDGYDKGEPHWQILDTGQIYFSVRPVERTEEGPRDFKALSPSFWQPSMNGKWLHLAVTCDVEARTITHYTNGNVLSRHLVPDEQMPSATRIGAASIGNWATPTMPDAEFAVRNLNGSIDEMAIFATALTADEIKEMYENGKP